MKLREWQRLRLSELRGKPFKVSSYWGTVTLVAYSFPQDVNGESFDFIESAILQSWDVLGALKTIIVSHCHFPKLKEFVRRYPQFLEVQVEPSLMPGEIGTMSADCCSKLYSRFSTEYCLVIQDDGFPICDMLGAFVGKWDFIGAPYVRISWWRNFICSILGYWMSNGGFSLRSRRICEAAAKYWCKYKKFHPSELTVDDLYYTKTLPLRHPIYRFKYRVAPNDVAIMFAYDALVPQPIKTCPFGFHRATTFEMIYDKGLI